MKYLLICALAFTACQEANHSADTATTDTMPTVKPKTYDSSRVVTPPPTGDSNVVRPDSSVESR